MKRLILALGLMLPMSAQPAQDPNEAVQKVVTVKYADPQAIANLLRNFGVDVRPDAHMKVLALSGPRTWRSPLRLSSRNPMKSSGRSEREEARRMSATTWP